MNIRAPQKDHILVGRTLCPALWASGKQLAICFQSVVILCSRKGLTENNLVRVLTLRPTEVGTSAVLCLVT